MAAVTICSDFGAPKNKVWHCFHCLPIYFPWGDGTRCHDLSFLNVELWANFFTFLFHFHWPFRYDLSQITYDYTVEVTNRCNGLDLIDRVPDELWMEVHDIVQQAGIKTIPKKKKRKKAKLLSEETEIAVKEEKHLWKEEKPKAKEKRNDIPIWMQSSKE